MASLEADIVGTFKYFDGDPALHRNAEAYAIDGKLHCCLEGHEELYDIFEVTIVVPFQFPRRLPTVIEKGGKIPRTKEHHIDAEGKCCLATDVALFEYIHAHRILTFRQYLEQIIITFRNKSTLHARSC